MNTLPGRRCLAALGLLAALHGTAHAGEVVPPAPIGLATVAYPVGIDAGAVTVDVEVTIDATGTPTDVRLVSGDEPFASLVVDAARVARFTAATEDGAPITVVYPMRWTFDAPPVNVSGQLLRRGDGAPLADVEVRVADRIVRTDADGRFALRNVAPGAHAVTVSSVGFVAPPTPITVVAGEAVALTLRVTDTTDPNEALGVYTRGPSQSRYTLDHDAILASPGAIGDPLRALANVPGVLRTPLDTGWLLVRGGAPDETSVYLDGVPIPRLYHLGGLTSVLHPELIDGVTLYPTAAPARLGRTAVGAVDIGLADRPEQTRIVGGVNVAFAHVFAEVPVGRRGGVTAAVRRSYLDAVLRAALGPDGARIAPRFWDAEVAVDVGDVRITALGLFDAANAPLEDGEVADVRQDAAQVQGRGTVDVGGGTLAVRGWLAWHRQHIDAPVLLARERQLTPGLRVDWTGDVLAFGLEAQHTAYDLRRDDDPQDPDVLEAHRSGPYAYADPWAEATFGRGVQARIGLRVNTLFVPDQRARAGLSPRVDLAWHVHGPWTLTGQVVQTWQPPAPLYLVALPDGLYLSLQRSRSAVVGARFDRGALAVSVDGWTRGTVDRTAYERDGSVGALEGRAAGVEVVGRYVDGGWTVQGVYGYTRSELREAAGDGWEPMPYEQRNLVHLMVQRSLPRDWSVGGRWRYDGGVPGDPDGVDTYDLLTDETIEVFPDRSGRLPAWHALDLRVARRFTFRTSALDVFLDVQNVYGRRIPEPAINGVDDSQRAYGYGLPVLPIFGVEGVFWPGQPRDGDQASERQRRERSTTAR